MKKTWFLPLLLILAAALLTGCSGNADTLASPTPGATQMTPMNTVSPTDGAMILPGAEGTAMPGSSSMPASPAGGITTVDESRKASEEMEDALEKLTEVDDAHVVAIGEKALVGLKFAAQYQGEVDERLKKMVLTRVQTVNKAITGVAVTADEALVKGIEALADTLESATSLSDVSTRLEEMLGNIQIYAE